MSIKSMTVMASVLWASFTPQGFADAVDQVALKAEAVAIVKRFGGALKPQLKQALQSGGPVNAIGVCAVRAPEIAKQLSLETGWQLKRVSLKFRHSKTAMPDKWEEKILRQFDERQSQGELPAEMAYAEVVGDQFRFIKAQGVEAICLTCHGETLDSSVRDALNKHYPDDRAIGYSLGQVRGAFSLSRAL